MIVLLPQDRVLWRQWRLSAAPLQAARQDGSILVGHGIPCRRAERTRSCYPHFIAAGGDGVTGTQGTAAAKGAT